MRRSEIVQYAARLAGLDERLIRPISVDKTSVGVMRPVWAVLGGERTKPLLPPLNNALRHFVSCAAAQWTRSEQMVHDKTTAEPRIASVV
jgi:hypothetical protein